MSTAAPEAPTRPTSVLPDIDLATIAEIDSADACQYDTCFANPHPPCPRQAQWLAVFRTFCQHGGGLEYGDPLLCNEHMQLFVTGGNLLCGGCHCELAKVGGWRHIILSFKEIK